jgi:tyrosyl-tRNA synthetase
MTIFGGRFTSFPDNAMESVQLGRQDFQPKRVKFGIDPTRDRLHLGHFVPLRLLRKLQDMGHEIHLILGTFTAQMGDPSGQDKTRPILSSDQVKENAEKILEQVQRILAPDFHVHRNHEFFQSMPITFFLEEIASEFTVASVMARDGFKKRGGDGVRVHEMLVPMCQAWDSVKVQADIEIGGTDQLFNFQMARRLQETFEQTPQVSLMTPVINGTDGRKMSKSFGNCIFLDDSPEEIFGKVMSISDEVMEEWLPLFHDLPVEWLPEHPMERKKILAGGIVRQVWGLKDAVTAKEHFEKKIQLGIPDDIIEVNSNNILEIVIAARECSKTQARRLIRDGAVSFLGQKKILDEDFIVPNGIAIKIGKRCWARSSGN